MLPGTLSNHYGTAVKMSETENQIARMSAEWELLLAKSANTRAVPMEWERSIASMQREVNLLRDQGRWLGGYRTLMHALGIQYREVYLTAGLAWLLDPDGWHGLGSKVLSGLLAQLGLPSGIEHPVTVSKEETRSAGERVGWVRLTSKSLKAAECLNPSLRQPNGAASTSCRRASSPSHERGEDSRGSREGIGLV